MYCVQARARFLDAELYAGAASSECARSSADHEAVSASTTLRACPVARRAEQENPDGFRFCGACGAELGPPVRRREVRKTVTVVFCDVTGSTALGERLDPEAMRRTMGRYFEEIRLIVERHGGTVEKFIGDAVMAVFGIPVAHEDDALRAVRAVAEIRERLEALGEELSAALSGVGERKRVRRRTRFGTFSPQSSCAPARTFAKCKSCSATSTSTRRSATRA